MDFTVLNMTAGQQSNSDINKHSDNFIFNSTTFEIFKHTTKVPEMQDFKIIGEPIRKGAFGKAFLSSERTNPDQICATKVMKKNEMTRRTMASQVVTERNPLAIVTSPACCVQLFYSSHYSTISVLSVMEYMVGRNLKNLLKVYLYMKKSMFDFYLFEGSEAYAYLRSRRIIREGQDDMLELDNILLSKEGHVKLADFDLGKISKRHRRPVEISDLVLEEIMAWNKTSMPRVRIELSCFVRHKHISRSNKNYRTMLLFKVLKRCQKLLIKQLLNSGVDINASSPCCALHRVKDCLHSLLMVNSIYGDIDTTRMLIRAGCRLDTTTIKGCTALHFALEFQKHDIAAELIRAGANIHLMTATGGTALQIAIAYCSTHIDRTVEILNKNTYFSCIMDYAWKYILSIFYVRRCKASQRIFKFHGKRRRVCIYLVKMLLDSGADVNLKDMYGFSAIHYAACTGNLELMKILIEAGAYIDSQNRIGATALHNAVLFDNEEIVRLLLNSGADIGIKTRQGDSALHWASVLVEKNCYVTNLRMLLEHGGNVNEKNMENQTIISLCLDPYKVIFLHVGELEARTQKEVFDEHSMALINEREWLKKFYGELQDELAAMRDNKIENTAISYLSVLTEPLEEVARWARNKEFLKNFEASACKTAYPKYASRLKEKIVAATRYERKSLKWCKVEFSCST